MTADVETECDEGNSVGQRKPSRVGDGETEREPFSPFIVLLGVGLLLVHVMDVNAPDACGQAVTSARSVKNPDSTH